jgi:hypothetical protein
LSEFFRHLSLAFGGERGIRTPGTSQFNGFQDRRNRPLCHLSLQKKILRTFFPDLPKPAPIHMLRRFPFRIAMQK